MNTIGRIATTFTLSNFNACDNTLHLISDNNFSQTRTSKSVVYNADSFIDILKHFKQREAAEVLSSSLNEYRQRVKHAHGLSPATFDVKSVCGNWKVTLDIPSGCPSATNYFDQIRCQITAQAIKIEKTTQEVIAFNTYRDNNLVRYTLSTSNPDQANLNWLFLPGGPGANSTYMDPLVQCLQLPGNVWRIDLPGNGDNLDGVEENYDFNQWLDIFPIAVQQFENPVLVGHSYGGMLPLIYPHLEGQLKGLLILNSVPYFSLEDLEVYGNQHGLPNASKAMRDLAHNPNEGNLLATMQACMPYYFAPEKIEQGAAMLAQYPYALSPTVWWTKELEKANFSAAWIPQNVPTLIVGCQYDHICPYEQYEADARFHRNNIEMLCIDGVGHMGWLENPELYKSVFSRLSVRITE